MIKQKILYRKSKQVDEGTMGFTDLVTKKESISEFVDRVTKEANKIKPENGEFIVSISYPNFDMAIIVINKIQLVICRKGVARQ